ncbi:hypothetical protein J4558_16240 [Leptolyngbya sp. 15MV]|nr:hypothetical protein J4558_16240 [Leptolyngbya sp. 15MV]
MIAAQQPGELALDLDFLLQRPFMGTEDALPDMQRLRDVGVLLVRAGGDADAALASSGAIRLTQAQGVVAWRLP